MSELCHSDITLSHVTNAECQWYKDSLLISKSSTISLARLLALVSKTPGEDVELEGEDVGCEVNVEEAEDDLASPVHVLVVHQPLHQHSHKSLKTPEAVEPRHLHGAGNVQPAQAPEAIPNPGHLDLETRIRSVLC